ncbi:sel1 repeat family protein [Limoniibacter endophyticus]|uniref:Sel1 repeat-containing protein n=1 Tax=Limoniibacter endophyticus TaxID=1565040 RepID=A0A8J3DNV4_9HYPH|nr:sel1 repeat family protein [Limoniibacter endophyticus]GHC69183.1 hypothetical protein GCM10010136_14690 [Limoniibacter endophyticus]
MGFFNGNAGFAAKGSNTADDFLQLGVLYATGKKGPIDLVSAHKCFNIAAIKGSIRAETLRSEISTVMGKRDIAKALRSARSWLATH